MNVSARKMVFATIIVFTLISISVSSVFAAGPVQRTNPGKDVPALKAKWKEELAALKRYEFLENHLAQWLSVWLRTPRTNHARAKKNRYLNEVHRAIQQAKFIVAAHAGFDENGTVINTNQANQSVHNLSTYLNELHSLFRHKLYKLHPHLHRHKSAQS